MEEKIFNWGIISKYRDKIMGLAILWIMLYHGNAMGAVLPEQFSAVNYILSKGSIGVEVFLFLSGMGLYYSFSKGYTLKKYYLKRLYRVILPYLGISLPYWILQDLVDKHNIKTFLLDYSLISFWTSGVIRVWFIALIIPLYLLAPLLYEYLEKGKNRDLRMIVLMVVLVAGLFVIRHFCPDFYENTEIGLTRIPVFIAGMYLAPRMKSEKKISLGELLGFVTILLVAVIMMKLKMRGIYIRLFNCFLGVNLAFIFALWTAQMEQWSKGIVKFLSLCGACSLELYITHVLIRRTFLSYGETWHIGDFVFSEHLLIEYGVVLLLSALATFVIVQIEKGIRTLHKNAGLF